MKLAVTPFEPNSIPSLLEAGADIILIGLGAYANRLTRSYSELELQDATRMVHTQGKEVYVILNLIVHHEDIPQIDAFLDVCKTIGVDGIIFSDLGVYQLAKDKGLLSHLIYNPETLNTNSYDPVFWGTQGIKGLTIAKEIPLSDLGQIRDGSPIELSMVGHGHLNMFHSRRPLIENYFKYNEQEYTQYINNRNLRLVEEVREESYPIVQDEHGTHIFRDKAMESFREMESLNTLIDVFIIDGIFKDSNYVLDMVSHYRKLIDDFDIDYATALHEQYCSDHDSGFLYTKTGLDKAGVTK